MTIFMNNRFNHVFRVLSIIGLMSGCAAESMMAEADMARAYGEASFPEAVPCDPISGGCFHGSMQCDLLDIKDESEIRSATCLNDAYFHSISGSVTQAICFERENMAGETCQVCQTQTGLTIYDDCMVDAEMRAESCEEDVAQLRDGVMYLCDICKDEDGTLISESCKPKESVCLTGVEQGPYLCEQCTLDGEIVFSECELKSVNPSSGVVYGDTDWECVDLYDGEDNLIRHHCTGGDVEKEKQPLANLAEEMTPSAANGVEDGAEIEQGSDGTPDDSSTGNGSSDGGSDGVTSESVTDEPDTCEDYFRDDSNLCTRCIDEQGTILSDACVTVDRRAARCERLETETEVCVFCTQTHTNVLGNPVFRISERVL